MLNKDITIPTTILEEIYSYAEEQMPKECCGFLVSVNNELQFVKAKNISDNPQNTFVISPESYYLAEDIGKIEVIVHSHVYSGANPSAADKVSCEESKVPWLIVSVPERNDVLFFPSGIILPYEERPFFHGVIDCYALVRDYYSRELGIELPNYYRKDNWWLKGGNMYLDLADDAGFDIITSGNPEKHDLLVLQIGAEVPSHGAVFLGNNIILHHLAGKKSCKNVYGGYWEKNTWAYLRHRDLK